MDEKESVRQSRNHLEGETSTYLRMHARNPVDWHPWGDPALEKARSENKLIIISIGYSACHWCHVMERESFNDPEVAGVMNRHFVAIKVDREERPDVDQIYLEAAQMISGRGGWPLNVIALPDGQPIFAGTYFDRTSWISLLHQISNLYDREPEMTVRQAEAVTRGIRRAGRFRMEIDNSDFDRDDLDIVFRNLIQHMDLEYGGFLGRLKFPLPVVQDFLLRYYHISKNKKALEAVTKTLDSMALGGIQDQIGGGFSRYSTDRYWKVPHFEKMLYDNAQLANLYTSAYQLTRKTDYREVIHRILEFTEREMTMLNVSEGCRAVYSSLDADSESEEGKYYTWTESEFKKVLGKDAGLAADYYNIKPTGNWESSRNILFRPTTDKAFAREHALDIEDLKETIGRVNKKLLEARFRRVRPALDNKIITAWNALMIIAYVNAYRVLNREEYLNNALSIARFLSTRMMGKNNHLRRIYQNGPSNIGGFLDDYAFTIRAFIALYEATFDEHWLNQADSLVLYTLNHFYHDRSGMFYYTSNQNRELISRKMEITDQVMPGSNSTMALNLFLLGHYFQREGYLEKSRQMLVNVKQNLLQRSADYTNWAVLLGYFVEKPVELIISGNEWMPKRRELDRHYQPHIILMGGNRKSDLPLLRDRNQTGETLIFACRDKTCFRPVSRIRDALIMVGEGEA